MLIEEIMKKDVIFVKPSATIKEALDTIQHNNIRHLPVIDDEKLVGIVTARNLRRACPSPLTDYTILDTPVKKIMKRNVITAHPLDFVEDVSLTMYEERIGCLPILQNKKLVGIITETDMLHTLIELTVIAQPSSQIEVQVEDQIGVLADIANIFKENQINVSSVFTYPDKETNTKKIVFRVRTIDPRSIVEKIQEAGYVVVWPRNPEN